MIGGLLGQLQQQFQNRPNWQASYNSDWQQKGNMQPSTAKNMQLMYQMNKPGVTGANGLTPNYTGLFGMLGQQPQPIGNASGVSQGDYLSRVLGQQQQTQGASPELSTLVNSGLLMPVPKTGLGELGYGGRPPSITMVGDQAYWSPYDQSRYDLANYYALSSGG